MGTSGILEDFVSSRWTDLNLNYKCFGIHMLIVFVCTATTQKKLRRKVKLHKISHRTQKWTGQNDWHLIKIVIDNWFSSMWCSCNLYLDTPVASNRCGQYSNHTCHQLKWRKVDSFQCVTLSTEKKKCKKLSVDLRDKIVEKHGQSQGYKSISRDLNVLKIFTEIFFLHAYFVSTILIRN